MHNTQQDTKEKTTYSKYTLDDVKRLPSPTRLVQAVLFVANELRTIHTMLCEERKR